jgi:hypothetical protein
MSRVRISNAFGYLFVGIFPIKISLLICLGCPVFRASVSFPLFVAGLRMLRGFLLEYGCFLLINAGKLLLEGGLPL